MKNIFLLLIISVMTITAYAQTRHCGTTEYYELRKQKDPSLERRMDENEKQIAKWIKEHPAQEVPAKAVLPPLPGFKISGNEKQDKINYASAKSKYLIQHGMLNENKISADINNDKSLRERKRKSNSFITKN